MNKRELKKLFEEGDMSIDELISEVQQAERAKFKAILSKPQDPNITMLKGRAEMELKHHTDLPWGWVSLIINDAEEIAIQKTLHAVHERLELINERYYSPEEYDGMMKAIAEIDELLEKAQAQPFSGKNVDEKADCDVGETVWTLTGRKRKYKGDNPNYGNTEKGKNEVEG